MAAVRVRDAGLRCTSDLSNEPFHRDLCLPLGLLRRSLPLQGRPFAVQECLLFLAALFYRFDVSLADPAYQLDVFQTITLNTRGMKILVKRREGRSGITTSVSRPTLQIPSSIFASSFPSVEEDGSGLSGSNASTSATGRDSRRSSHTSSASSTVSVPLYVLYGSNSGTCEYLAKRVASNSRKYGSHHIFHFDEKHF